MKVGDLVLYWNGRGTDRQIGVVLKREYTDIRWWVLIQPAEGRQVWLKEASLKKVENNT